MGLRNDDKKATGDRFEKQATAYLSMQGLTIVAHNYRVPRVGEIDIIAYDPFDDVVICVEVKARQSASFGTGGQAVTEQKQAKLVKTMSYFLLDERYICWANKNIRFDVMAYDLGQLTWLKAAFMASDFLEEQ